MNWYKSESDTEPVLIDDSSSPTTVFFRRNVEKEIRTDEDNKKRTVFVYEEAMLTRDEYVAKLNEKTQADIEYLYMMGGFDYE